MAEEMKLWGWFQYLFLIHLLIHIHTYIRASSPNIHQTVAWTSTFIGVSYMVIVRTDTAPCARTYCDGIPTVCCGLLMDGIMNIDTELVHLHGLFAPRANYMGGAYHARGVVDVAGYIGANPVVVVAEVIGYLHPCKQYCYGRIMPQWRCSLCELILHHVHAHQLMAVPRFGVDLMMANGHKPLRVDGYIRLLFGRLFGIRIDGWIRNWCRRII
eukprot:575437_1